MNVVKHTFSTHASILSTRICKLASMSEYGKRLAHALNLATKERKDLAAHLEISVQAVGQVIRGETGAFTSDNNARAAKFLTVDPYWLATGEGEARPKNLLSDEALALAATYDQMTGPQRDHFRKVWEVFLSTLPQETKRSKRG